MFKDITFYFAEESKVYIDRYKDLAHELVVSAYVVNDKQVCLIDHSDLKKWLPPGGHVRQGESSIHAVKREVYEETGCNVEVVGKQRLYAENNTVYQVPTPRFVQHELIEEKGTKPHIHVNLVYFCKALTTNNTIITYEGSVRWFEMNNLDRLERLYPHTKMNAFAAIRELGGVIPESLILQNDRILVPIGGRCTFACSYCYTKRHDVYFGESNPNETIEKLKKLINELDDCKSLTAQIGYDNDPFLDPEIGLEFIYRLLWIPVHVGFSTKAYISKELSDRIARFRQIKNSQGYNISALVTLTCLREETIRILEPYAPSIEKRLQTIKHLSDCGIPVMINLRPILPMIVSEEELRQVIQYSKDAGACGIVMGAFWTDPEGIVAHELLNTCNLSQTSQKKIEWSPHGMNWTRYEDSKLLERLTEFCKNIGILSFDSSAEAVKVLNSIR